MTGHDENRFYDCLECGHSLEQWHDFTETGSVVCLFCEDGPCAEETKGTMTNDNE